LIIAPKIGELGLVKGGGVAQLFKEEGKSV